MYFMAAIWEVIFEWDRWLDRWVAKRMRDCSNTGKGGILANLQNWSYELICDKYFFRVEGATERAMSDDACSCRWVSQPAFAGSVV